MKLTQKIEASEVPEKLKDVILKAAGLIIAPKDEVFFGLNTQNR